MLSVLLLSVIAISGCSVPPCPNTGQECEEDEYYEDCCCYYNKDTDKYRLETCVSPAGYLFGALVGGG